MRISPLRKAVAALAACVLAAACESGSGPPEPVAGELVVRVSTPNPDRALRVRVRGPGPIGGVTAGTAGYVVYGSGGGAEVSAAAFGTFSGESDVLRFSVPDVNRAREYSAVVEEAADAANQLRPTPLAGYGARVSR